MIILDKSYACRSEMQINHYSTKTISKQLLDDISTSLQSLDYGSLEIYVVDSEVTQISKKQIKKTNGTNSQRKQ